jgi:hypothetical protein
MENNRKVPTHETLVILFAVATMFGIFIKVLFF